MEREDLLDLNVFAAVASAQSFTDASKLLGTSQSALSYAVRRLEDRIGVRLLNRTTRRVSLTEDGEQLLQTLQPAFEQIADTLTTLRGHRGLPKGKIRICATEHALMCVMWPILNKFAGEYPDVKIDIEIDQGDTDIVGGQFDAGVRLGEDVEKDMVAVRIGPDLRMAVVGAPEYFQTRAKPLSPNDLSGHICINYRRPLSGRIYPWCFEKSGRTIRARVEGQITCNRMNAIITAAKSGRGLGCVPEDIVADEIKNGSLIRVLDDWCKPYPGFHLYYPSQRHQSVAFSLLVDALRLRSVKTRKK